MKKRNLPALPNEIPEKLRKFFSGRPAFPLLLAKELSDFMRKYGITPEDVYFAVGGRGTVFIEEKDGKFKVAAYGDRHKFRRVVKEIGDMESGRKSRTSGPWKFSKADREKRDEAIRAEFTRLKKNVRTTDRAAYNRIRSLSIGKQENGKPLSLTALRKVCKLSK